MSSKDINQDMKMIETIIEKASAAQKIFENFTQKEVDKIFKAAAKAAASARIELAKAAVEETGMGVLEDKVIKNHYASEFIYNTYKDEKTCGVIYEDEISGIKKIAMPMGVIAAVIPTTNPTSTTIFKCLLAIKTRNAIVISSHPRAKKSSIMAAKVIMEAACEAGLPDNIINWIEEPDARLTNALMKSADIILATGGQGMVRAAYSSGKPAIGVGAGNTPIIIDSSADIKKCVSSIIHSKTFDNGMICSSEQAIIVMQDIYTEVKKEFALRKCYFLNEEETEKVRKTIIINDAINAKIVGQSAVKIAHLSGVTVPDDIKILIGEVSSCEPTEEFSHEKLSPVLAMYMATSFDDALDMAEELLLGGGIGHTSGIYIDEAKNKEKIEKFSKRMKTCRILINCPAAQGAIGALYNFKVTPSLTLGCGSWGMNSVSDNVGVRHLLNIKTVADRRENMQCFFVPNKIFINSGSTEYALEELSKSKVKRAFIVTDRFLFKNNHIKPITKKLDEMNIFYSVFSSIDPDPTLKSVKDGTKVLSDFKPDCIIAFGGGSAIDAAKIMWTLYENPDTNFKDLSMRFMDISRKIADIPVKNKKSMFVAIPTTAGTGSEVTPFAVITDEESGTKYPIADYSLMPDMAIIDTNFHKSMPKELAAFSAIDALTHALEAYVSIMATDFTDAYAKDAIGLIFKYLPVVYNGGENEKIARDKLANAATMAGIAFANAFLGVCHSMAHKLGAEFHLPHGLSNALMIEEVIRFNSNDAPTKMATFSKYDYPKAKRRYAEIAEYLGVDGDNDDEKTKGLIKKINELKKVVGIKDKISDYGVCEEDFLKKIDDLAEKAFDDQCIGANPRYPLIGEIKTMYENAYYGKSGSYAHFDNKKEGKSDV